MVWSSSEFLTPSIRVGGFVVGIFYPYPKGVGRFVVGILDPSLLYFQNMVVVGLYIDTPIAYM